MKKLIIIVLLLSSSISDELIGTGASLPFNLIADWVNNFESEANQSIIYLPIGLSIYQLDLA